VYGMLLTSNVLVNNTFANYEKLKVGCAA
jgi:hypothetical protein